MLRINSIIMHRREQASSLNFEHGREEEGRSKSASDFSDQSEWDHSQAATNFSDQTTSIKGLH